MDFRCTLLSSGATNQFQTHVPEPVSERFQALSGKGSGTLWECVNLKNHIALFSNLFSVKLCTIIHCYFIFILTTSF